jgi:hypothetical protein
MFLISGPRAMITSIAKMRNPVGDSMLSIAYGDQA